MTDETRTDVTRIEEAAPTEVENPPGTGLEPVEGRSVELEPSIPYSGATGPDDREWTHDPLERSFFGAVGRGYVIGLVLFGVFGFLIARTQAKGWGIGAAIGAGVFVAFWVGVLGAVVMIGRWAMRNEEAIRGNETGHSQHGLTPTAKTTELLEPIDQTGGPPASEADEPPEDAEGAETAETTERADPAAAAGAETTSAPPETSTS